MFDEAFSGHLAFFYALKTITEQFRCTFPWQGLGHCCWAQPVVRFLHSHLEEGSIGDGYLL